MKTLLAHKNILCLFVVGVMLFGSLGFTSPAAAQSSCGATYTVQRGDYLTKIAKACGVSYRDLLKANPGITNPTLIYAGRVLYIPLRVQFASGGTAIIVQGSLKANRKQVYLLEAGAGQTLEVTLSGPASLTLGIQGADGKTVKSATTDLIFRGVLPRSQDYLVIVGAGSSDANYSLSLAIPERIRFASGGSTATLTGTVPANLSQFFILRAGAGQTLNVTATPDDKLQLIIYGVDGSVLRSGMGEGASFTGTLPSTQDYILVLRSAGQAQAFSLTVSIPATPPTPVTLTYTVQRGDTLFLISLRFQTTVNTLLRLNPQISNANLIFTGQRIAVP